MHFITADAISKGWTSALHSCFQETVPSVLLEQLEAYQVRGAFLLGDLNIRLEEFFTCRKECRVFKGLEQDTRYDELMLSSPFCTMLFPEEVVSSCLKEVSSTHSFPSVAFKRKTVTFKVTARKKKREVSSHSVCRFLSFPVTSRRQRGFQGKLSGRKRQRSARG